MSARTDKNRQDFEQELAKIRGHADLTDEAKRRRIAEAHEGAAPRHRELVAEQERKAAENLGRLERGVIGIRYPMHASDGDKELVRMSRRDAYDRAERVADEALRGGGPDKLTGLLGRAERSGDSRLAEAVYHVATERGVRGVADGYLQGRPNEKKRWEDYAAAAREDAAGNPVDRALLGRGPIGPTKPAELGTGGAA